MNKKVLIAIVALIVVLGGGLTAFALTNRGDSSASSSSPTASSEPDVVAEPSGTPSPSAAPEASAGTYVEYSDTAIADAAGTTALLFFHAPWCPQCRAVEADIMASGVPEGVTIIKVDYDSRQDLRQQYGVTLQTTFVRVDASGGLVESFVAYDSPTLSSVVDALL